VSRASLTSLRLRRITSSPLQTLRCRLVRTTDDGRCGEYSTLAAALFFALRDSYRTVDNTGDMYAAKPDIRPESRFLPTPPAVDTPRGFPSEYCHAVWYEKKLEWLGYPSEQILKICLFVLTQLTNVTDTQTDRHRMTA